MSVDSGGLPHVVEKFLSYASNKLDEQEISILKMILNQVFIDLGQGHSCTDLTAVLSQENNNSMCTIDVAQKVLKKSDLVLITDKPINLAAKPFCLVQTKQVINSIRNTAKKQYNKVMLLFVTKYLAYELSIATKIGELAKCSYPNLYEKPLQILQQLQDNHDIPNSDQLTAIKNSASQKLSIITGGPGTGKTTTILFLLWLLYKLYNKKLKIKICAPTGKAAKRAQSSIVNNLNKYSNLLPDIEILYDFIGDPDSFVTIHKLLGSIHNNIYFKHNSTNLLDIDILIVDESSMVALPLFSKLLQAINGDEIKHIIFLGDKNQLSSIEEGYVFATLVQNVGLTRSEGQKDLFTDIGPKTVNDLNVSKRNIGDVHTLAQSVLLQNYNQFNTVVKNSNTIKLYKPQVGVILKYIINSDNFSVLQYVKYSQTITIDNDIDFIQLYQQLSDQFTQMMVLCLTNVGMLGTSNINQLIEKQVLLYLGDNNEWYMGKPIIILENDYAIGVSNGDIGFCIMFNDQLYILFEGGRMFIPEVLPKYQIAYAITIHKAQGSEYNHVNIIIPDYATTSYVDELLSRELIYTAITRAHTSINIFATFESLVTAVKRVTIRNTGLNLFLE